MCVCICINIQMYICIQVSPIMHLLLGRDDWWSVLSVDPSTCTASVEKKKIGFSEAMDLLGGWREEEVAAEREARRREEVLDKTQVQDTLLLKGRSGEECSKILSLLTCVLSSAPADVALEWMDLVMAVAGEAVWSGAACVRASGQELLKVLF